MDLADSDYIYERVICRPDEFTEVRLSVKPFREKEYLHIREFYQDFDHTWKHGKGISMELSMESTREMFEALLELLSLAESKELVEKHFKDLIENLYQ